MFKVNERKIRTIKFGVAVLSQFRSNLNDFIPIRSSHSGDEGPVKFILNFTLKKSEAKMKLIIAQLWVAPAIFGFNDFGISWVTGPFRACRARTT